MRTGSWRLGDHGRGGRRMGEMLTAWSVSRGSGDARGGAAPGSRSANACERRRVAPPAQVELVPDAGQIPGARPPPPYAADLDSGPRLEPDAALRPAAGGLAQPSRAVAERERAICRVTGRDTGHARRHAPE